jgi:hypothetical protein
MPAVAMTACRPGNNPSLSASSPALSASVGSTKPNCKGFLVTIVRAHSDDVNSYTYHIKTDATTNDPTDPTVPDTATGAIDNGHPTATVVVLPNRNNHGTFTTIWIYRDISRTPARIVPQYAQNGNTVVKNPDPCPKPKKSQHR